MKTVKLLSLAGVLAAVVTVGWVAQAQARYYYRQYYTSYYYYPQRTYYYSTYYYKPYQSYDGYKYHYAIYYPSYPRYVYYYNPYRSYYWGRYDVEAKGYSMLKEEDRKGSLKDIPDSAFPKPAAMPAIPESTDTTQVQIEAPPAVPKE